MQQDNVVGAKVQLQHSKNRRDRQRVCVHTYVHASAVSIRNVAPVLLVTVLFVYTHIYKYHSAYKQACKQHKERKQKFKLLVNKKMNEIKGKLD